MARWTSLAGRPIEQRSSPNTGGQMTAHRGIVLHHAEGGYRGTIDWQLNPDQRYGNGESVTTSSTWVVGKEPGQWAQLVDTDTVAWCQRSGSYTWNSIELAGYHTEALTDWQIEACAQLLAEHHRRYGTPLQVTSSTAGAGLGHHSMDDDLQVEWGHDDCPGAQTIAAKPAIVARAVAIINGEDEDMATPEEIAAAVWAYPISSPAMARTDKAGNWLKAGQIAANAIAAAEQHLTELATQDNDAPAGAVTLEQAKAALREVFADAGTAD